MKRSKIGFNASKRLYKRTANKTNVVNLSSRFVPRGGIRF